MSLLEYKDIISIVIEDLEKEKEALEKQQNTLPTSHL